MATTTTDKPMLPAELRGQLTPGAYNLDQMYRFAQICQQSGLFADITDAAQAFIKIAKGQEMGVPPMVAMQSFDIIAKRLFVKPTLIAAKINSCGYGRYKVLEQSPERCVIRFARKVQGIGWEDCPEVSYTIKEAEGHGLVKRSPHWQINPAHMLYQRCMGRGGAMYFPELLAGLEPPPDDTLVSEEQRDQNVIELYGEPTDPTAYAPPLPPEPETPTSPPPPRPERPVTPRPSRTPPPAATTSDTNGSWLENVRALTQQLTAAEIPMDLAVDVQDACARAARLDERTPLTEGEAMLETLRRLYDRVAGQLGLGLRE